MPPENIRKPYTVVVCSLDLKLRYIQSTTQALMVLHLKTKY